LTDSFDVALPITFTGNEMVDMAHERVIILRDFVEVTITDTNVPVYETKVIKLLSGCYLSPTDLISSLNAMGDNRFVGHINFFLLGNQALGIKVENDYAVQFDDKLAYTLGYQKNRWYIGENTYRGNYPIDLNRNLNTMFIYTPNLILPQHISDTKGSLIREVSPKKEDSLRTLGYPFNPLFYCPVASSVISDIRVVIVSDFGEEVIFPHFAQSTFRFHIRPHRDDYAYLY
jgi:hypothetical protein